MIIIKVYHYISQKIPNLFHIKYQIFIQYLAKLDSSRATSEESLKEVAISLCAVDRLLGNDEKEVGVSAVQSIAQVTDTKSTFLQEENILI